MEAPCSFSPPVALIPAYKPEPAVLDIARALLASEEISDVVVVNDGSGAEYDTLFQELADMGATVLRHYTNLGKGMALRTGLNHIACAFPHSVGVVTLDADGQHLAKDVLAVAARLLKIPRALIMGCRRFGVNTPLRSRVGNNTTRRVMRLLAGLNVSDTQTGLRGIPFSSCRVCSVCGPLDMILNWTCSSRPKKITYRWWSCPSRPSISTATAVPIFIRCWTP